MSLIANLSDLSDLSILQAAKERVKSRDRPPQAKQPGAQESDQSKQLVLPDHEEADEGDLSLVDLAYGNSTTGEGAASGEKVMPPRHSAAGSSSAPWPTMDRHRDEELEDASRFPALYRVDQPSTKMGMAGSAAGMAELGPSGSSTPRSIRRMPHEDQSSQGPRDHAHKSSARKDLPRTLGDILGPAGALRVMLSPGARGGAEGAPVGSGSHRARSGDRAEQQLHEGPSPFVSPPVKSTGASLRALARAIPSERGSARLRLVGELRHLLRGKVADASAYAAAIAVGVHGENGDTESTVGGASLAFPRRADEKPPESSVGGAPQFDAAKVLRPWVERHVAPVLSILLQAGTAPDPVSPSAPSRSAGHSGTTGASAAMGGWDAASAIREAWLEQRAEWESVVALAALLLFTGADVSVGASGLREGCVASIGACMAAGAPAVHPAEIIGKGSFAGEPSPLEALTWPRQTPLARLIGTESRRGTGFGATGALEGATKAVVPPSAVPLLCSLALSEPVVGVSVEDASLAEASGLLSPVRDGARAQGLGSKAADCGDFRPKGALWAARELMALGRGCTDAVGHTCVASVLHSCIGQSAIVAPLMCATLRESAGVDLEHAGSLLQEAESAAAGAGGVAECKAEAGPGFAEMSISAATRMLHARAVPPKSAVGVSSGVVAALACASRALGEFDQAAAGIAVLGMTSVLVRAESPARRGSVAATDSLVAARAAAASLVRASGTMRDGTDGAILGIVSASTGKQLEPLRSIVSAIVADSDAETSSGGGLPKFASGANGSIGDVHDLVGRAVASMNCVFHALSPQQCADVASAVDSLEQRTKDEAKSYRSSTEMSSQDAAGKRSVATVLGLRSIHTLSRSSTMAGAASTVTLLDETDGAIPAAGGLDAGAPSTQFFVEVVTKRERSLEQVLLAAADSSGKTRGIHDGLQSSAFGRSTTHASTTGAGAGSFPAGLAASMARTGFIGTSPRDDEDALYEVGPGASLVQSALLAFQPQDSLGSPDAGEMAASSFSGRAADAVAGGRSTKAEPHAVIVLRRRFLPLSRYVKEAVARATRRGADDGRHGHGHHWSEHCKPRLHVVMSSTHLGAAARVALFAADTLPTPLYRGLDTGVPTSELAFRAAESIADVSSLPPALALAVQLAYKGEAEEAAKVLEAIASGGCAGVWRLCGGGKSSSVRDQSGSCDIQADLLQHAHSLRLVDEYPIFEGGRLATRAVSGEGAALGSTARSTWIAEADTPQLMIPADWDSYSPKRQTGSFPFRRWMQRTDEVLLRVCEWSSTSRHQPLPDVGAVEWDPSAQSQRQIASTAKVASLVLAVLEICHNRPHSQVVAACMHILEVIGPAALVMASDVAATVRRCISLGKGRHTGPRAMGGPMEGSAVAGRRAALQVVTQWSTVLQEATLRLPSSDGGELGTLQTVCRQLATHLARVALPATASAFLHSAAPLELAAEAVASLGQRGIDFLCSLACGVIGLSAFDDWPAVETGISRSDALRTANPGHAKAALSGSVAVAGRLAILLRDEVSSNSRDGESVAGVIWHVLQSRSGHGSVGQSHAAGAVGIPVRTVCEAINGLQHLCTIQKGQTIPQSIQWVQRGDARQLLCSLLSDSAPAVAQAAADALASMGSEGRLVLTEMALSAAATMRKAGLTRRGIATGGGATGAGESAGGFSGGRLSMSQMACIVRSLGSTGEGSLGPVLLALQLSSAASLRIAEAASKPGLLQRSGSLRASTDLLRGTSRSVDFRASHGHPSTATSHRTASAIRLKGILAVFQAACEAVGRLGSVGVLRGILVGSAAERARNFRRVVSATDGISAAAGSFTRSSRSSLVQSALDSGLQKALRRAKCVLIAVTNVCSAFGGTLCGGNQPLATSASGLAVDETLEGTVASRGLTEGWKGHSQREASDLGDAVGLAKDKDLGDDPGDLSAGDRSAADDKRYDDGAAESRILASHRADGPKSRLQSSSRSEHTPGEPQVASESDSEVLPQRDRGGNGAVEIEDGMLGDALRLSHLILG